MSLATVVHFIFSVLSLGYEKRLQLVTVLPVRPGVY